MSMSPRFMLGTVLAALLVVEGCTDYQEVQLVRRAEEPNAAIEANIIKLREAKQKLSANPTDKAALSVILTLIKDPNGINRSNAANTLGELGEEDGSIIKGSLVPVLIDMFERGDGTDQYAALKALRSFGPDATGAIPILEKVLQSPDAQKSWIAAETLGRMKAAAREAVPALVNVIKKHKDECRNDELHICRFAIQALGRIGPAATESTADLIPLLNDANPYLHAYAAVALIRIQPNGREAVAAIARLLADQDVEVRRRTIWELRDVGKEARPAESLVRAALHDKDEAVRRAASELLELLKQ